MMERLNWERRRLAVTLEASRAVRGRAAFLLSELRTREATREYRLRETGLTAVIRHPMTDIAVLRDIFCLREYDPPEPIAKRLRSLSEPRVLDLGGHVGLFALFIRGLLPGAEVVSFEPDPRNLVALRRCVDANDLDGSWTVVPSAAGAADGETDFISDFSLSQVASAGAHQPWDRWIPAERIPEHLAPVTTTVPVVDVFPYLAGSDLVKIDIEGGEWDLLADPRFAETSARALVMEAHFEGRPEDDPPRALRERLAGAGFSVTGPSDPGGLTEILWAERP
jgi:FkbM family methyltransferase